MVVLVGRTIARASGESDALDPTPTGRFAEHPGRPHVHERREPAFREVLTVPVETHEDVMLFGRV